jgi:hypothetical protein
MQKLKFAEAALGHGDPEATILHLSHFFDLVGERLDAARLDAAARHIELLRAAAERLKNGLPLPTATVVARSGLVAAATLLAPPDQFAASQPPADEPSGQS